MRDVVLAEDSATIRHVLTAALARYGFRIHDVLSGRDVIAAVRSYRSPVLIMNRMLPGRDGLEVLRAVRADPVTAGTRVMMLTDTDRRGEVERGISEGADDYVIKPFDPDDVARRVDRLARRAAAGV